MDIGTQPGTSVGLMPALAGLQNGVPTCSGVGTLNLGLGTSMGLTCVCAAQHVRVPVPVGGVHIQAGRQSAGCHDSWRTLQIAGGHRAGEHLLSFLCGGVVIVYTPNLNWKTKMN